MALSSFRVPLAGLLACGVARAASSSNSRRVSRSALRAMPILSPGIVTLPSVGAAGPRYDEDMEGPKWRQLGPCPVEDEEGFVEFLDAAGICLWRPLETLDFPNLAEKMDLAKPDDIWDTWFWKDDLHEAKRLYYGKLLGGRPTFVAMRFLPAVIAALGDVDPYTFHERGTLTAETLRVYEALVRHRQLTTGELRREAGLASPSSRPAFDRAVTSLCALFQICKTGITGRTRGTYGYRWGLVEDWIPEVLAQAARLRPVLWPNGCGAWECR